MLRARCRSHASVNASHTGEISRGKNKCTLRFVDLAKAGSQKCRYTADNWLAEGNAHDFFNIVVYFPCCAAVLHFP